MSSMSVTFAHLENRLQSLRLASESGAHNLTLPVALLHELPGRSCATVRFRTARIQAGSMESTSFKTQCRISGKLPVGPV